MKTQERKYAVLYHFSYLSIGAMMPLIGQYLDHLGYTGTQIGSITAAGTTVAIFATAFWGGIYDRMKEKQLVLMALCIMASAACAALSFVKTYIVFVMGFGIMYFFRAPVMSLTDAFTIERMQRFGTLRAWGAVGFALGIFLAGNAAELFGIDVIFLFYIVSFCISAFVIWRIGRTGGKTGFGTSAGRKPSGAIVRYLEVLKDRRIRTLIICAFFMGGTNVANNTYFSFLYMEGGGTVTGVGAAMLLMVGSEVPFMAWSERLANRFTAEKLILAAMIISVGRFLLYGMGLPWWALILLAFSQGAVNGILLTEFVRYVSRLAPVGHESLAVSAYYMIGSNFSTICCQAAGGVILDAVGAAAVYIFFGLFNLAGMLLYSKFIFNSGKKDEKSD